MALLLSPSPSVDGRPSLSASPMSGALQEQEDEVTSSFRPSSRLSASASTVCLAAEDELDLLAQRAISSPSAFLSLLQLLRPRLYSAVSLEAADPLPSASSLRAELDRVQAHFSKLKLANLHLEAKTKFLSAVQRLEAVPTVEEAELQEAEAEIAAGRQAVASLRQSQQSLTASIGEMADMLSGGWQEVEQQAAAMQDWQQHDWKELQQLMHDSQETELSRLFEQSWIDARLAEQQQQQAELSAALAASSSELQQQQSEMQRVQARTEEMEEETACLLRSLQPDCGAALRWWRGMLQTTARLSGVELRQGRSERSLVLRVRGWQRGSETEGAELEVDCVPGTTQFNGVSLLSGSLDPQLLDAAVDFALDTQDLAFLVHEIQSSITDQS